tara:strand:- start:250 stop:576 length:327 start_codon:yes stop_codon:yes gene_type:complete
LPEVGSSDGYIAYQAKDTLFHAATALIYPEQVTGSSIGNWNRFQEELVINYIEIHLCSKNSVISEADSSSYKGVWLLVLVALRVGSEANPKATELRIKSPVVMSRTQK